MRTGTNYTSEYYINGQNYDNYHQCLGNPNSYNSLILKQKNIFGAKVRSRRAKKWKKYINHMSIWKKYTSYLSLFHGPNKYSN